jgi:hypothetical protein
VAHALVRAASAIVPTLTFEIGVVPLARMRLVAIKYKYLEMFVHKN